MRSFPQMIGDASLSNVHNLRNPAGGGYANKEAVRCLCKRKLACCWRMSSRELFFQCVRAKK